MSAKDTKTTAAKTAAAKRRERAAAKKAGLDATAASAAVATATEEPTVPAEPIVPPTEETPVVEDATPTREETILSLFASGQTIAAIARTIKQGQQVVRDALDAAGVDSSIDSNSTAAKAKATPAAAPKAATTPGPKSLLDSYKAILAKKVEKDSKRGKVVADLAKGGNHGDLVEIVASLSALADGDANATKLAVAANALNAALSAHYARVS